MNEVTTDIRNAEAQAAADELSTYKWGFNSDIEQEFAPCASSRPRRTSRSGCSNGG
jgi:hypothetical protein